MVFTQIRISFRNHTNVLILFVSLADPGKGQEVAPDTQPTQ